MKTRMRIQKDDNAVQLTWTQTNLQMFTVNLNVFIIQTNLSLAEQNFFSR